jgi:predicted O-methyltransferase YrrM
MAVESDRVTDRHFEYIAERTTREDKFLKELRRESVKAGIPAISIGFPQASFMQILLRARGAHDVVEVGTLAGYSAIVMARALPPGGTVRTIELVPKHADFAEQWIAKSDVAGKIQVLRGKGADVLKTFESESADAAFLDADKSGYPTYLTECLRIVRRGGVIMADNAFAFGELFEKKPKDRETPAVKKFNEIMAKEKRLQSIMVPFGDGMWFGVKL